VSRARLCSSSISIVVQQFSPFVNPHRLAAVFIVSRTTRGPGADQNWQTDALGTLPERCADVSLVPLERTLRPREVRSQVLRAFSAEASTREGDTAVTPRQSAHAWRTWRGKTTSSHRSIKPSTSMKHRTSSSLPSRSTCSYTRAPLLAIGKVVSARRAGPAKMQRQLNHAGGFLDACRIEIVRHCGNLGDGSCQSFHDCLSVPASPGSATPKSRVGPVRSALCRGVRRVAQGVQR
jgi:hypothetical protein